MTIHICKTNYQCSKCDALFIPYKIDIKCPNCGTIVPDSDIRDYSDSIKGIAESMKIHKAMYDSYSPPAWFTSSMSDHVQSLIFELFDKLEAKKPKNQKEFIINSLKIDFEWGDQVYLKKYIQEVALDILSIYGSVTNISDIEKSKIKKTFDIPY